jgi:hypothetical protein
MKAAEDREQAILELLSEHDWAKGPLTVDTATAVEIRLAIIDNRSLRKQVAHLRAVAAELAPVVQQLLDAAIKHITPVWTMLKPYLETGAPMGAEWDVETAAGYETDPEPRPKNGDRGTCAGCAKEIEYCEGAEYHDRVIPGFWFHLSTVPETEHPAQLGGPA